jgi:TPR repeat protein
VAQSNKEAFRWFKKSAELGFANAQFNIAQQYGEGEGIANSHEKAVQWYAKAAAQGHVEAQHNLGLAYKVGRGIEGYG